MHLHWYQPIISQLYKEVDETESDIDLMRKTEEAAFRAASTDLDPRNAHDTIEMGLKKVGFEIEEINKSIGTTMWNLGLD